MATIRETILQKLEEIERREGVTILHAVESGSRAWGVESPDSDYDVRFIYIRPLEAYLQLQELRDVIEWELDDVMDINGWDLKKALIQFHRGNATLFEWANSPVVYKTTPQWQQICDTAKNWFSAKAALHHYRGTARGTFQEFLQGDAVRYKKYIYALRPLLACKYIEAHHTIPPVRFDDLLKQELPEALRQEIDRMLEIKAQTDEKALNPRLPVIHAYIQEELKRLDEKLKTMPDDRREDWDPLNDLFRNLLQGL
ncbi:MAG: nucleotidyltransferase domain-containing protein [Oscillospiraceae bacterium]|nr:nucleotidyltransferase domain-containing protein [Oscillospiraceae bacterium]